MASPSTPAFQLYIWKLQLYEGDNRSDTSSTCANLTKYQIVRNGCKSAPVGFFLLQVLSRLEVFLFITDILSFIGSNSPQAFTYRQATFIFLPPSLLAHYTVTCAWKPLRSLLTATLILLRGILSHSCSQGDSVYICFRVADWGIFVTLRDRQGLLSLPDWASNDRLLSSR